MLWSIPAGAQRQSKPMPASDGAALKMDKTVPVLQKRAALSQEAISLDNATMKMVPKMNRIDGLKTARDIYSDVAAEEQLEMVKSYMRAAFAPQARTKAPKAGGIGPKTFIGGALISYDLMQAGLTARFTINEDDEPSLVEDLECPIYNASYNGFPYKGTWNGQYFEGMWAAVSAGGEIAGFFGYYIYDPVSNQVQKLKNVNECGISASAHIAYDYSKEKNFALQIFETAVTGEDGKVDYEFDSVVAFVAVPNTGVYTKLGKVSGLDADIVAMTITKEGVMYAIAFDGKLYSISTDTWVATEVGSTGLAVGYSQSMAADYRSGKLYWDYYDDETEYNYIAEVNTTTGVATTLGVFDNILTCMASLYYPDNNPQDVADFALSYENGKVQAGFTVPTLTVNGDAIESLASVEIGKVTENAINQVWSKSNPTPGEEISQELENTGNNGETVTLAVRVKDANGIYSDWAIASVLLFNATLPYANGFEDADQTLSNNTVFAIDPQGKGGVGRVNTEHYEGSYSFQISGSLATGDDRQMVLRGIPVEKGGGYTVSFYVKTDAEEDGVVFAFDGADFRNYYAAYNDEWMPVELSYVASATGQMSLTLQGYGIGDGTKFFIDNLKVVQTSSAAAPAAMTINDVTAAENGALQAIVNVTLPDKTMAGETLAKIDSIVFECVMPVGSSLDFSLAEKTTVKTGLTPGATTNVTVPVSKAGRYCLRALIYSGGESHPEYAKYGDAAGYYLIAPWIGSDMPASVKVTATPNTDGTVTLEWLAPTASHQGYIGTVTYTVKDAAGTQLYSGTNLTFTTAALALGMHTFTFEMTNGIETKTFKANSLAGIQSGMIYSNVSTSGTTESRVLNVSATAANSAFSQMLYPATNQAMYIDTLVLFATAPETGEATQDVKIYMGTTDQTAFGGSAMAPAKDFVEKKDLTEVFAGTLRFKAGENMLKLPLSGFYYDGTKTLVINIVKPMQEKTTFAAAAYVAVSEGNMLKFRTASTSVDFDTVASYNDYTGTPNGYAVSMVATPGATLKALEVTVTEDGGTGTALENAIITITRASTGNADGKNLNAEVTTGSDGKADFAYMPQGKFEVKVQKAGYISKTETVTVDASSPATITLAVSLLKAKEVKVSGTVKDKGGNKLAGVAVKAAGLADFTATTNTDGEFELQGVYGPGEYTLSFEKAGMKTLSAPFVLGEKDTTLAKSFEMGYEVMAVSMASATVQENGSALVKWNTPSVSTMVSWTSDFTQMRRLTIDNETPFKYAQRFLPEDLADLKLGNQTKAISFGFVVSSETAKYSIVLAADTTHEIYRAEVPADKLKVGEWCNIDIPAASAAIDVAKELWLIVEVSGDNQDYPCAATTTGTVVGKGNLMTYEGEWYPITELFTNGAGNVLIRLLVEDASTQLEPANGYRVYRGLLEDEFEAYTQLTAQPVKEKTYTDAAYSTLPFGQYKYAVVADWYGDDLAEPAYTGIVNKDMEFTVTFKVTSNAGSAEGAYVYMVDTARTGDYEGVADAQGEAVITRKVWRDVYDYEVSLPYHGIVEGQLNLTQDTVINVALQEIVLNPELTVEVNGKDVVMNYGVNLHNWSDDVESYADFAISGVEPWILSEGSLKYGIRNCTWPNSDEQQSWIVMNPSQTQPALSWAPLSGDKYFLCMSHDKANNDYLVHPVSKGGGLFTFFVRAISSSDKESFEVVYSTTTADFGAFKVLQNGSIPSFTSTTWAKGAFMLPEDTKYVGIRCTSNDAFGLIVDDLSYMTEEFANPTAYELYLDGTKVKDAKVDELTYTFKDLAFGTHKVGVKAIYASGASELVEKTVKVSAEAMPINLNVAVEKSTAVLTWDIPAGFTPKSYQVFLGKDKVAENITEKTYTFTDLKNGKYTAAVVAVYETGVSEKATVNFQITGVDVETVSLLSQSYIYPNPNNGTFYLNADKAGVAEVYSLTGKKMQQVVIPDAGTYAFDIHSAQGMYVVKFVSGTEIRYFKVIVR